MKDINYSDFKVAQINRRYVTNSHIVNYLHSLGASFHVETLGTSVQRNPIYSVTVGTGPKRILMWSQMHGNESTTTKAVLDLINYLKLQLGDSKSILEHVTLKMIPILNPDGAKAYTRVNANQIDLNRDAQDLSQPESKVLKSTYIDFKPHYCFNLHDQRTIFNVGETKKPATISFLAPAFDKERNLSKSRIISMQLIAAMNNRLQEEIPGQVGRYDDSFNANCVGDAFQMRRTPTILFEAGHYPMDYEREVTRKYVHKALMEVIRSIQNEKFKEFTVNDYQAIPNNHQLFCDVLIKNAHVLNASLATGAEVAVLFQEKLEGEHVQFVPKIMTNLSSTKALYGHVTKDAAQTADRLWLDQHAVLSLF
jgi:hypothetical protein